MKQIFSTIAKMAFAVIAIASMSSTADAQTYYYTTPIVEESGLSFDISHGTARLWQSSGAIAGEVKIPASIEKNNKNYNVTELKANTFCNCKGVSEIIVPSTVEVIENNAFVNCKNLTTIVLPNKFLNKVDIKTIATKCPKLKYIVFSDKDA